MSSVVAQQKSSRGRIQKFLNIVETGGNKLPNPIIMFFYFTVITYVLSLVMAKLGVEVSYETLENGSIVEKTTGVVNLMSVEGIRNLFTKAIPNFTGHPALGTILIAMLGVGVAEKSGLIDALIKKIVLGVPAALVTPVVIFAGVMSNVAADAGYVVLIPLGAIIFMGFGRHPLAGMAAAFAGVSGGFSANLVIGTVDTVMAGITQPAAQILDSTYTINPASNWYFIIVSTFLITGLGWWVTDRIVEPALGRYRRDTDESGKSEFELTALEVKGLRAAGLSVVLFGLGVLLLTREGAPLGAYAAQGGKVVDPFMEAIVFILGIFFFLPGVVFGFVSRKFKNGGEDIVAGLVDSMKQSAAVIVIIFVSAQFIYAFTASNIGTIIAVRGAEAIKATGFSGTPLMVVFIVATALINLFIGGLTSKWMMMSPVFVPLFMQLGFSPEYTMLAYRIGDSTTNIISPLMSYFPIIVAFAVKYKRKGEDLGVGTLVSMMLPYSVVFLGGWIVLFVVWSLLGIPIGPGTATTYIMG
ncbi:aminobenzoyl-glutamate transporter [Propionigenium maris DSM 9537]|uniref:Aminobenzoyl-glutamate transporter n=1 Tax=Propionigenium maris DSM 9537 TaxID=1123000 RepID=A0A9W6LN88_9FUSO|nr:AbgT family transporter [Propionigenium maris]GLI56387.1 aminobenzoyl-glutamate transporter [Propionigenium maris DSM 9537]